MEIVLKFNIDNSYGVPAGERKNPLHENEPVANALWVAECAMCAVSSSFKQNSVRRNEMSKLYRQMLKQIKSQLTPGQYEKFKSRFAPID